MPVLPPRPVDPLPSWMPALLTSMSIPKSSDARRHTGVHLRLVGDVHADADSAVHIAEFGRNRSGTRLIKISDDNFGACATEDARDFPTYAARRASNDGDLAFEIHGKFLSFVLRD
jgi:hypothetical protein